MREILFRGKRIDNGKWVQGGYAEILPPPQCFLEDCTEKTKYCIVIENGFADWNMPRQYGMCEIDPETIGQYTGLKDKNGTMIFEGDYLNISEYPFVCDGIVNYYGEVEWLDDEMLFALITHKCLNSSVKGISDGNVNLLNEYDCGDIEIIGNIHDKEV